MIPAFHEEGVQNPCTPSQALFPVVARTAQRAAFTTTTAGGFALFLEPDLMSNNENHNNKQNDTNQYGGKVAHNPLQHSIHSFQRLENI